MVSDIRVSIGPWQNRIAAHQAMKSLGRPSRESLRPLIAEMENARHRLMTEVQAQGQPIRSSASVRNVLKSLERAIDSARKV